MKELKFNGNKLVTGPGAIDYIKNLDGQRIFVVTGKSAMFKNGAIDHIKVIFAEQGKTCEVYSGIGGNPTTDEVLAGLAAMKAFDPDTVMAVGGGSSIDATKVMTLMCEYPELTLEDIRGGTAPAERKKLQFIAAPSTSGTASEVTRAAVITFTEENIKVGLKTTAFIPDIAILDGNLTLSMPKHVMVETGMDALTHAVESYINKNNDDFCKFMSKGAVEGLCAYLPLSYEKGDVENRQKVHNFQCLAGLAFQNLPYVLKYNARDEAVKADLDELSRMIGADIIKTIEGFNAQFGVPKTFREMGISEEDFNTHYESLLDNSMKGSTARNPVPMTREEMDKVLKSIYYGDILF